MTRYLAELALAGMGLDLLGGCYLAYDLLDGNRGPLRALVRTVGYVSLFFLGSVVLLGLKYALVVSVGMGILLPIEYRMAAIAKGSPRGRLDRMTFGVLRGLVFGSATMTIAGVNFGTAFGLLTGASYATGFSPSYAQPFDVRPRVSKQNVIASIWRMLIATTAGLVSALLPTSSTHSLLLGLKLGLAAGMVSAVVGTFSPSIEWWIEHLPKRQLGTIGLSLIFLGVLLQSVQYWVVVWDVPLP